MSFADAIGLAGAGLMFAAFAGVSLEKLNPAGMIANGLNLIGAILVLISLRVHFNLAAAVLEAAWALVAAVGLVRLAIRARKRG